MSTQKKKSNVYFSRVKKSLNKVTPKDMRVSQDHSLHVAKILESIIQEICESCMNNNQNASLTSSDFQNYWKSNYNTHFKRMFPENTAIVTVNNIKKKKTIKKKKKKVVDE